MPAPKSKKSSQKAKAKKSVKPKGKSKASAPKIAATALASHPAFASALDSLTDKSHSVGAAVAAQLTADRRWPPNDITKVMGTDYQYLQTPMVIFLKSVAARLAQGNPAFQFTFDGHFVIKAMQAPVGTLIIAITASTTP